MQKKPAVRKLSSGEKKRTAPAPPAHGMRRIRGPGRGDQEQETAVDCDSQEEDSVQEVRRLRQQISKTPEVQSFPLPRPSALERNSLKSKVLQGAPERDSIRSKVPQGAPERDSIRSKVQLAGSKVVKRSRSFNRIFSYSMLGRSKEYKL